MAPKPTYKELEQRIKGLKKEADKRGQAEEALRKSEQEKTAILESISEIVIYVDTDMRVIWANNVLLKAFNLSRDQIEGKFCYQGLHNRNKPCSVCPSMKAMESGKAEETEVVSSYGKKWILRGYPVRDKVNGIIGAVEVATDVTAIKQVEEVQRQSEEKYRAILESTGTAMIIAEEDTTVSLANAEFERLFGYSRNEVEWKKSWTEFVSKADLERMTEYHKLRRVDSSSAPRNYEFKSVDRQGNTRDIYATVAVIPGTKKSTASFIDITERKRMEGVLRESERRLSDIINFLPDATFAIDLEGKVITWNRAIEEMTGVRAKDMVGKGEHEYAMPFYGARRPILIDLVLMPEEEVEKKYSIIFRKGDCLVAEPNVPTVVRGKELFLWGKASPIHDSDGNIIGGIESIRDITDRKLAEEKLKEYSEHLEDMVEKRTGELRDAQEQLIRKEKLAILGQLAGGVGHELRNPLGVISNAVYYLKMVLPDADETIKEYMDIISSEVRNSEKIVSDLLDFSRIRQMEKEEIEIIELVTRALEKQPPPENVKVVTQIPADILSVYVDIRQLGQVLINLISNACQAMPEGGRLTIQAKGDRHGVRLSIADTGSGIPEENMEKIFDPLFTTRARGIGLGLAVSRNLIEANGGRIEVKSEDGKGSTFTITLPAKEEE